MNRPAMLRAAGRILTTLSCAVLIGGAPARADTTTSPAQNLFDEVTYYLNTAYGGPGDPRGLATRFQSQLNEACAADGAACPPETAVVVIDRMLAELGDGHTTYLPPSGASNMYDVFSRVTGQIEAVGMATFRTDDNRGQRVIHVLPDGPAERAGLRRGDVITRIGDESAVPTTGGTSPLSRASERDGWIFLRFERYGQEFTTRLLPGRSEFNASLRMRPDGIAVLTIPHFIKADVGRRVFELVDEAARKGAQGIIVDVRDNSGGFPTECATAAGAFAVRVEQILRSRFIPQRTFVFDGDRVTAQLGNAEPLVQYTIENPRPWTGPTIVLTSPTTVSCGEFFAADMQASGRALVMGEATHGVANSATTVVTLPGGGLLLLTVAVRETQEGKLYPERVTPDIVMKDDLEALNRTGRDDLLERAAWIIKRGEAPTGR